MSPRRIPSRLCNAVAVLMTGGAALLACGPFLPSSIVTSDETVLSAPLGDFQAELRRIRPATLPAFCAVVRSGSAREQTAEADAGDLRGALARSGASAAEAAKVLREHAALRRLFNDWGPPPRTAPQVNEAASRSSPFTLPDQTIPAGLPGEFEDYLRGQIAYYQGRLGDARVAWQELFHRPSDERMFRSTWAAFMIGKTYVESEPERAVPWFEKVRQLARDGSGDSLGLASSSLGWEARAELLQEHYGRALELYLQHMASGDPTAIHSLSQTAHRVLDAGGEALAGIAANRAVRHVITAYILAADEYAGGPRPESVAAWLRASEAGGVRVVEGADRLACAAYRAGDLDGVRRWAALGADDSMLTHWVRGKLCLRAGQIDEAAGELAEALRLSDNTGPDKLSLRRVRAPEFIDDIPTFREQLAGQLGAVQLSRGCFVESLGLLVRGGYWLDAAYVAERVLTIDELRPYVDSSLPVDAPQEVDQSADPIVQRPPERTLRYLLARRLARAGRWDQARPYFPRAMQSVCDAYASALRDGADASRSAQQRAESLWTAAQIARRQGMELLGTELAPDWSIYGGQYDHTDIATARGASSRLSVIIAGPAELARATKPEIFLDRRFHYRYIAAEHAWDAARLLPDESERTAMILWQAGSWLKWEDPGTADRFYKALVRRCGTTALGAAADRLRWFPQDATVSGAQQDSPIRGHRARWYAKRFIATIKHPHYLLLVVGFPASAVLAWRWRRRLARTSADASPPPR